MSRILELAMRLTADVREGKRAFADLKSGAVDTRKAFAETSQSVGELTRRARGAHEPTRTLGERFVTTSRQATGLQGQLRGVGTELSRNTSHARTFGTALGKLRPLVTRAFAGLGIGGLASGGGMVEIARRTAQTADEFEKMRLRVGGTTEELSRLAYAASKNDATNEDLANGLRELSKRIADGAEGFEQLGIKTTNADGSLRSTTEVFVDIAEELSKLPPGAQRADLAMQLLGERVGLRLVPLLDQGREGLQKLGEESDRVGKTISSKLAKESAEFLDNLTQLQALLSDVGRTIGIKLIPVINELAEEFLRANNAGLSFTEALVGIGLSNPLKSAEQQIAGVTKKLKELQERRAEALRFVGGREEASALLPMIDREIERKQKELRYWQLQVQGSTGGDSRDRLAETKAAEAREEAEIAARKELEQTRDVLKDNAKAASEYKTELVGGLRASANEAKQLRTEITALLNQANAAKINAERSARERLSRATADSDAHSGRVGGFSVARSEAAAARKAADDANFYAAAAQSASIRGDAEAAQKYAERAAELIRSASDYAGSIEDDRSAAQVLNRIGAAEQSRLKALAAVKQNELKEVEERNDELAAELAVLEEKIANLTQQITEIEVTADTENAKTELDAVKTSLEEIPDEKLIVIKTVRDGTPTFSDAKSAALLGLARGGHVRGAGTGTSDSIFARLSNGEYVMRAAAVRHYGRDFFAAINAMALPRFADGGLVSPATINPIVESSAERVASDLVMPGYGRFQISSSRDVHAELSRVLKRAALACGSRTRSVA